MESPHQELLKNLNPIVSQDPDGFASFMAAIQGTEDEGPNYERALRRACTAQSPLITQAITVLLAFNKMLGFDIDAQAGNPKRGAIHHAAMRGNTEVYDLLVRYGADPRLKDGEGKSGQDYMRAILDEEPEARHSSESTDSSEAEDPLSGLAGKLFSTVTKNPHFPVRPAPGEAERMEGFATELLRGGLGAHARRPGAEGLQRMLDGKGTREENAALSQAGSSVANILGQLLSPAGMAQMGRSSPESRVALQQRLTKQMVDSIQQARRDAGLPEPQAPAALNIPEDREAAHEHLIGTINGLAGDNFEGLVDLLDAVGERNYVQALRHATRSEHPNIVKIVDAMLKYQARLGFSVNTQDPETGNTPLHESIIHRKLEMYYVMVVIP